MPSNGRLGRARRSGRRRRFALPALVVAAIGTTALSSAAPSAPAGRAAPRAAQPVARTATLPAGPVASPPRRWHFDPTRTLRIARHARARVHAAVDGLTPQSRAQAPLPPAGLPITWCGQARPAGQLTASTTPAFQLVYAHPADQPDHFAWYANLLQADASYIDRFIAVESGGTEFMRFAMGTSCGPQYVSLIDWAMPQPDSAYTTAADPGSVNFDALDSDAIATFGRHAGVNTLIFADGLVDRPGWDGDTYGGAAEGLGVGDARPGPENINNAGGQFSFLFGLLGGHPIPGDEAVDPPTLLHEASHAIGAVGPGAPNSTGAGHCYDINDIMCYADGGPQGQNTNLQSVCGPRNDVMQAPYDCTGTNYYNPAPAPGSYLATHWNLYNSDFMAPCTANPTACGAAAQPPIVHTTTSGRTRLTVTATTLPSGSVATVAAISGLPAHTRTTVCLRSPAFYPNQPRCGSTSARTDASVTAATLYRADGEGWRDITATARTVRRHRIAGRVAAAPLRSSVLLP
jgi:hypothetical protein